MLTCTCNLCASFLRCVSPQRASIVANASANSTRVDAILGNACDTEQDKRPQEHEIRCHPSIVSYLAESLPALDPPSPYPCSLTVLLTAAVAFDNDPGMAVQIEMLLHWLFGPLSTPRPLPPAVEPNAHTLNFEVRGIRAQRGRLTLALHMFLSALLVLPCLSCLLCLTLQLFPSRLRALFFSCDCACDYMSPSPCSCARWECSRVRALRNPVCLHRSRRSIHRSHAGLCTCPLLLPV